MSNAQMSSAMDRFLTESENVKPITVANASSRKNAGSYTSPLAGQLKVIQSDLSDVLWILIDDDVTLDSSWLGILYTQDSTGAMDVLQYDDIDSLTITQKNNLLTALFGSTTDLDVDGLLTTGDQDLDNPESVLNQGQAKEVFTEAVDFLDQIVIDPSNAVQVGGNNGSMALETSNGGRYYDFNAGTNATGHLVYPLGSCYSTNFRGSFQPFTDRTPFEIQIGLANLMQPYSGNTFRINCNASAITSILPDDGSESGVILEMSHVSSNSVLLRLGVASGGTMTWTSETITGLVYNDSKGVLRLQISGATAKAQYIANGTRGASSSSILTSNDVSYFGSGDSFLTNSGWVNLTASNSTGGVTSPQSTCAYIQYIKQK